MKKLLCILTAITLLASCQPKDAEITKTEQEEIAEAIKTKVHFWIDSLSENTPEIFEKQLDMWVEDNDKAWVGDPAIWVNMIYLYQNKGSIREQWNPDVITRQRTNFVVDQEHVAVMSRESALYVFKGSFSITDGEGVTGPEIPMSGSYNFVLRNGDWKVLHNHQSWKLD